MTDIFSRQLNGKVRSKKAPETRTRKALQVLQVSARDQNVLVGSPGKMLNTDKVLKPSKESLKISDRNDHTIKQTLVRRSKRKNANAENQDKVASKEVEPSKSKSIKVKVPKASQSKKKVVNSKKPKNEEQILPQQSYISVVSKLPETTAANVWSENKVFSETNCDTVLVGDPSKSFWKLKAEQYRKDLEVAINENAQLQDELEVFGTENAQLKSLLKEAEEVAEILKASLA